MSFQENIFGLALPFTGLSPANAPARRDSGLQFNLSNRLDARQGRPRLTPQDLVSLLFRQRARARIAALPRVSVKVSVFSPSGRPAVQISL